MNKTSLIDEAKKWIYQNRDGHWEMCGIPGSKFTNESVQQQANRQQAYVAVVDTVKRGWGEFLQYFNSRCNEFCRKDPSFAPFLKEIVLFEDWSFDPKIYVEQYLLSKTRIISILANAEQYPDKFISAFYSIYQSIPKDGSTTGIFLKVNSDELAKQLVERLYSFS